MLAYRQERMADAIAHFKLAAAVHPRSSVLTTYLGLAYARAGQPIIALDTLKVRITVWQHIILVDYSVWGYSLVLPVVYLPI